MKKYVTSFLLVLTAFSFVNAQVNVSPQAYTTKFVETTQVGDVEDTQLQCLELTYTLKLRSRDAATNNEVTALQEFLLDIGLLDTDPTGYFGAATLKAVKAFQKQNGLITSGLVGSFTRAAIKERTCGGVVKPVVETIVPEKPSYEKNMLTVYMNGTAINSSSAYSKDDAYRKCKEVIAENISLAMVMSEKQVFKCVWNNEVIYTPSAQVLEGKPKVNLGGLVIYKNGDVFAKIDSMSKDDAYTKCKAYQASYTSSALKCVWSGEVIYVTSNEVLESETKSNLNTLIVYKNGDVLTKVTMVSKDDAYSKCKYVQASYSSTAIKCIWNEEVIYATSNEAVACNSEQTLVNGVCKENTFQYTCSNGKVVQVPQGAQTSSIESKYCGVSVQNVPTFPQALGASTICVNLKRNFHRGDESEDTRLLQMFLISQEFMDGEVSGFYGDKTVEAVKRYQRIRGLPETGMVYDFTRAMINNDSCR